MECERMRASIPYPIDFGIGVVAVSGDHRSLFGLRFGLGIAWRPFCATNGASGFR